MISADPRLPFFPSTYMTAVYLAYPKNGENVMTFLSSRSDIWYPSPYHFTFTSDSVVPLGRLDRVRVNVTPPCQCSPGLNVLFAVIVPTIGVIVLSSIVMTWVRCPLLE